MLVTGMTYFIHSFAVLTTINIVSQPHESYIRTLTPGQSPPISGIAYCLVILRFALGGAFNQSGASPTSATCSPSGRNGAQNNMSMDPIRIDISHDTLSDNEANLFGKAEDGDSGQESHVKACA